MSAFDGYTLKSPAGTSYPWPLCEEDEMTDLLWLKHHVYNLHLNYGEPCGCGFCVEYRREFGEDPTPVGPWDERNRAAGGQDKAAAGWACH